MSRKDMAWRTCAFAVLERRIGTPIDEVADGDYAAARAKRFALQKTAVGRFVFGTADKRATIEDRVVSLDGVDIRLRIYRPASAAKPLPVVLNFHGGGWVQGNPEQSEWASSRIAVRVEAIVISVSYRLAPEHPFPAAVNDCWAATLWVQDHAAELGGDPDRLAVMGDSAGGNLAAVTALKARDVGWPIFRAQILIYPGTEMYDKWPSEIRNAEAPVLTSRNMRAFTKIYLAEHFGTEEFLASPIRAVSHAGVAPALIQTAEFDPLLDNGARYANKLRVDGVDVSYTEYAGAIHGYLSLPGVVPVASQALDEIVETLKTAFQAL